MPPIPARRVKLTYRLTPEHLLLHSSKVEQGPFSTENIQQWLAAGHLTADRKVKRRFEAALQPAGPLSSFVLSSVCCYLAGARRSGQPQHPWAFRAQHKKQSQKSRNHYAPFLMPPPNLQQACVALRPAWETQSAFSARRRSQPFLCFVTKGWSAQVFGS